MHFWFGCDSLTDAIFICDIIVQLRTGYLEQGLMVSIFQSASDHYFFLETMHFGHGQREHMLQLVLQPLQMFG